jgi:GGDEF domain-containing protein
MPIEPVHWLPRRRRDESPPVGATLTTVSADPGWSVAAASRTDLEQRLDALDHAVSSASRRLIELMNELDLDPVTGVLTAPAFLRALARLQADGAGRRLVLLHLWAPDYGTIMLRHGAASGSVLLAHLAHMLQSLLRDDDPVGRPAADELAAVMRDTEAETARLRLRTLCERAAARSFPHGGALIAFRLLGTVAEARPGQTAALWLHETAERTRATDAAGAPPR